MERLATVAVLAVASLVLWRHFGPVPTAESGSVPIPPEPISIGDAPTIGAATSPGAMIVFSDFECPFCGKFARESWPSLRQAYVNTGRVIVAFRHMPLETIPPLSLRAAEAANCGARQGRFWQLHDQLFAVPEKTGSVGAQNLREDVILQSVGATGVDVDEFKRCFSQ